MQILASIHNLITEALTEVRSYVEITIHHETRMRNFKSLSVQAESIITVIYFIKTTRYLLVVLKKVLNEQRLIFP